MLLSIIVPIFNMEKYLDECLTSIVNQIETIKESVEVLLIDDGSTDGSGRICDKYAYQYSDTIRVFHNINQGLLLTRRFSFSEARGEYIVNCDADDTLELNALTKLIEAINKFHSDVILYNCNKYDGINKTPLFNNIFPDIQFGEVNKRLVLQEFLLSYRVVSMCCKCFKKQSLDLTTNYERYAGISNGEDTLQSLEIYSIASSFCYINESLYNYRMFSGMTSKFDDNYYESFKLILEQIELSNWKWQVYDFDKLLAVKYFSSTGRALTQLRFGDLDNRKFIIRYLKKLSADSKMKKFKTLFFKVIPYIQNDYIVLYILLFCRGYNLIWLALKVKKSIMRGGG